MLRWDADEALGTLIARYYAGEAGLWGEIQRAVDAELRRREIPPAPRHLRLRRVAEGGYEVILEDAAGYAAEP
ncbi:MAG: hypothetical protein RLZZ387_3007 [Chloroflexota bacterium]